MPTVQNKVRGGGQLPGQRDESGAQERREHGLRAAHRAVAHDRRHQHPHEQRQHVGRVRGAEREQPEDALRRVPGGLAHDGEECEEEQELPHRDDEVADGRQARAPVEVQHGALHAIGVVRVAFPDLVDAGLQELPAPLVVLQPPETADSSTGSNAAELVTLGIATRAFTLPRTPAMSNLAVEAMAELIERLPPS